MTGKIEVRQHNTVDALSKDVTTLIGYGYTLLGEPFALDSLVCQMVIKGDDQPVTGLEYKVVERYSTTTIEKQLEVLLNDGWDLYGIPFQLGKNPVQAVKKGDIPVVSGISGAGGTGSEEIFAIDISDSTIVGRSVITAADAAAARTAIGAGTSNLALGTTGTTAKAGNYVPTSAEVAAALKAKAQIAALTAIADPATATAEAVATTLNAVIAALKA